QLALLPHDDLGPTLIAVTWTMSAIATLFLALRISCKLATGRRPWWDDYIFAASWVSPLKMPVDALHKPQLTHLGMSDHPGQLGNQDGGSWLRQTLLGL